MPELLGGTVKSPVDYDDKEVKLWFHKLDQGIKRRNQEAEKFWNKNEAFDEGEHWSGTSNQDEPRVNKVASWINTHIAEIAFKNPRAKLTPATPAGWDQIDVPVIDPETGPVMTQKVNQMTGAIEQVPETRQVSRHIVTEGILNKVAGSTGMGLSATTRRFVRAAQIGYGAIKTGYKPLLKPEALDRRKTPETHPETGLPMWENYEFDEFTGKPLRDKEGYLIPEGGGVIADKWFIDWVHYRRMIIDPDGGNDFRTHSWVAYEFLRPLKDVKKDPRYKNTKDLGATGNTDAENLEAVDVEAAGIVGGNNSYREPFIKDETDVARLFEIWDLREKRVLVLADGHGQALLDEPAPDGIDHTPYVFLRPFERIAKTYDFYPKPPCNDLIPLNDELNKARQQQMRAMRKETRKYIYDRKRISDKEAKKLTSPEDMQFIGVDLKAGESLADAIIPVPNTQVSPALFQYIKGIELNFDEVAGQPSEARGQARAETATQVENMQMHATLRVDDQRNQLSIALSEMFKKLLDSIQTNMTTEQAVMLMGPDGKSFQTIVDHEMIVGDYDVTVDVEEMTPRNKNIQMAQFGQFLNMILGSGDVGADLMSDPEMSEAALELYGISDQRLRNGFSKWGKRRREQQEQMAQMQAQAQQQQQQQAAEDKEIDREMKTDDQRIKMAQMFTKESDVASKTAAGRQ